MKGKDLIDLDWEDFEEKIPEEKEEEVQKEEPLELKEEAPKAENPYTVAMRAVATIFGVEKEEIEDVDESQYAEFLEATLEQSVEDGVKEQFELITQQLGDDGAQLLKYLKAGGTVGEFLSKQTTNFNTFDISTEVGQEIFLKKYLKESGELDDEEIEDRIEAWKDRDKLSSMAAKYMDSVNSKAEKERRKQIDAEIKQAEAEEEERRKSREKLVNSLSKVTEVNGVQIGAVERAALLRYITKPTEKSGDTYITPLAAAIRNLYKEKPEQLLLLAKFVKNGLKFEEIEAAATKTAAAKLKKDLEGKEQAPKSRTDAEPKPIWETID